MLDEACEIIDEVTVQGVLHRNTAAKRKDGYYCHYRYYNKSSCHFVHK